MYWYYVSLKSDVQRNAVESRLLGNCLTGIWSLDGWHNKMCASNEIDNSKQKKLTF